MQAEREKRAGEKDGGLRRAETKEGGGKPRPYSGNALRRCRIVIRTADIVEDG